MKIECGLPFCQSSQREQTNLSIGLRLTAVAVAALALLIAGLIHYDILNLAHIGSYVQWTTFSVGVVLVILAAAIKGVKKQSALSDSQETMATSGYLSQYNTLTASTLFTDANLQPAGLDAQIKNGHGEFVVFSKSGKDIDSATYTSAYKIFEKYSLSNILQTVPTENRIETFGKRGELIEQELQILDSDLSAIFIPRTLYELVFIHACIEEDLAAGMLCPLLDINIQKLVLGHRNHSYFRFMEEKKQQDLAAELQSKQAERKCWHLCHFEDSGDSMHPKVIEIAYRLNQLIVNKIQKKQEFKFSDISELLKKEIEFLENYHKECATDKYKEIVSCTTPGPTTQFGYEYTRGDLKPMGIRNQKDAEILYKTVAIECSEVALQNVFLFCGYVKKKVHSNYSVNPSCLVFGTSLFSGVIYEGTVSVFHYMRDDANDAFALILPLKDMANEPFFVPVSSPICELFGEGKIFRDRLMTWEGKPVQQGIKSWEQLKTNMPRNTFVNGVEKFSTQSVISMK